MENQNGYYESRDLYLAAYLLLSGANLIRLVPHGDIVYFHFEKTRRITDLVLKYRKRDAAVEPVGYTDTIRNLRHMVRDALEKGG